MFNDKDIICFLGDSITAGGLWMAEVYQTLKKKRRIKCYNCGVSGGKAFQAKSYLYSNCLIHNPDTVVISLGTNDIASHWLNQYHKNHFPEEKRMDELEIAFERHKESYERIVKACLDFGSKVIICLSTPYDEVSEGETENLKCQYLLDRVYNFQRDVAKKYNCFLVDFPGAMLPMLGNRDIICPDRIHPTPYGYHVMAQTFLEQTGEIQNPDYDTVFVFEDWNKMRYDTEQKLHRMDYIEFSMLFDEWEKGTPTEEKKRMAKEYYDSLEDKTTFVPLACLDYINNIDYRAKLRGQVVKLTIF